MMQVRPDQAEQYEFDQWVGHECAIRFEGFRRAYTLVEEPKHDRQKQKQSCATDPMQDRNDGRQGHAYLMQSQMFRSFSDPCLLHVVCSPDGGVMYG